MTEIWAVQRHGMILVAVCDLLELVRRGEYDVCDVAEAIEEVAAKAGFETRGLVPLLHQFWDEVKEEADTILSE